MIKSVKRKHIFTFYSLSRTSSCDMTDTSKWKQILNPSFLTYYKSSYESENHCTVVSCSSVTSRVLSESIQMINDKCVMCEGVFVEGPAQSSQGRDIGGRILFHDVRDTRWAWKVWENSKISGNYIYSYILASPQGCCKVTIQNSTLAAFRWNLQLTRLLAFQ